MTTEPAIISELSKERPEMKFNSIGRLINYDMLKACHDKMDGYKAVGTDGISKAGYNDNQGGKSQELSTKAKE